jgi:hypothetical protein
VSCSPDAAREKRMYFPESKDWSGLVTLDIEPSHDPDVIADMNAPLPFEDHSFAEVHAYEVLEHLGKQGDIESFFAVFGELWRILEPGGAVFASVPDWKSIWAWGDPGHRRVINEGTLAFLDQEQYRDQVGKTTMADYRGIWTRSFKTLSAEYAGDLFCFVLQAA